MVTTNPWSTLPGNGVCMIFRTDDPHGYVGRLDSNLRTPASGYQFRKMFS